MNGNHGQAPAHPGQSVVGYGSIGWPVGSGRCIGGGRVSHGKSGTYRPAWLVASAGIAKNPVKSVGCCNPGGFVRVQGRGAMTYLWEHSLSMGIMISPIYGTMQGICGKQNYLSRGIMITYLADMTLPITVSRGIM